MPAHTAASRTVPAVKPSGPGSPEHHRETATTLIALPWWRRFDVRLAAIFGGISLLIITVSAIFTYVLIIDARMDSFRKRLESVALGLAQTVEVDAIPSLASLPDQGAAWRERWQEKLLAIVRSEPDIDSIYILLATDQPAKLRFLLDASKVSRVASHGELYDASEYPFMLRAFTQVQVEDRVYADEFGATQSGYAPLRTSSGEVAGIIGVDVLAVHLDETRAQVLRFCLVLFGFSALAILAVAALVRHLVRRPISRVLIAADDISVGRYETRTAILSRDEFGLLGHRIDAMAGQLAERERIRATLGLYVSSDLARTLLATGKLPELGGAECLATVVFCDLAQYTRISECFTPAEIVTLINEYLGAMTEVIESHGGCVLDFNGDGIMAVFGAPIPHPDHVERAVRSALRMQQRMNQLNGEWETRDLALRWQKIGIGEIVLRIGIHTGPVVAGNIGNRSRMRYCVMGDTVNVAARLEEMNKELGTRIALSEDVRQRCPSELVHDLVDCDLRTVRGRQTLLRVHAL
ncbi:MAG: adenylate/guanylate cyclase domain-containing protein [Verrucomicrobia bacterium]|nr:adenylate/guanylate cyclase domain-containing protein [Verrucomicrobiota bacterium]